MSKNNKRAPRSFNLDSVATLAPQKKEISPSPKARKPRAVKDKTILQTIPDEAAQRINVPTVSATDFADSLTPPPPSPRSKRFRWSRVFWLALTGLLSLGIGLWVDQLIRDLFSRQDWLGWLAVGLAGLLVLAALAVVIRELFSLRRMTKIDGLRANATRASIDDDMKRAQSVLGELEQLYSDRPDTAHGRNSIAEHGNQIINGRDLIALAERDLMKPLDDKARALVMGSAKRVSVVTAVSPRALVDIGFVLVENARLIRRLSELYGGRPTTLGFWRLTRNVVGHLAVTGTLAVGEGLVQQMVGHGLAAKISSRLGEGVINGLLTARIGISAIDVCRPLPFTDQTRPTVKDFMGELVSFSTKEPK
ncbi:MAG: TIGR01620 family protein [Rhizobiaceae bacterium]